MMLSPSVERCNSRVSESDDRDSETEEEETDPWMPMVKEAMQKHKAAFQEMKMN